MNDRQRSSLASAKHVRELARQLLAKAGDHLHEVCRQIGLEVARERGIDIGTVVTRKVNGRKYKYRVASLYIDTDKHDTLCALVQRVSVLDGRDLINGMEVVSLSDEFRKVD